MSRAAVVEIAICCAAALAARAQAPAADVRGAIDFHAHSGPDAIPRLLDDLELAPLAQRQGMRGLVLKNHFVMTADRAALVMEEVTGIEVFGGIVLNRAVGGLNAEAVRAMATWQGSRGKVVWCRPATPRTIGPEPARTVPPLRSSGTASPYWS